MEENRSYQIGKRVGEWLWNCDHGNAKDAEVSIPGGGGYDEASFRAGIEAGYAEAQEKEGGHGGQQET